jgi:hypothetical protein
MLGVDAQVVEEELAVDVELAVLDDERDDLRGTR